MEKIGEDIMSIMEGRKSIYILVEISEGSGKYYHSYDIIIVDSSLKLGKRREDEIIRDEVLSYKWYRCGRERVELNDISNPIMRNIYKYMKKYCVISKKKVIYYGLSYKRAYINGYVD